MKSLRVGILGTGGIAAAHVKALQKLPAVQVVGLCNHNRAKAEAFNDKLLGGQARCYDRFATMLAEVPLDVVYFCIPPGAHKGEVEAAAAKGLHVFLEKPIALTIDRAESIADAVRKAGVKCQMGHHFRHMDGTVRLKKMIEDGSAGKPLMLNAHWYSNRLHSAWWRDPNLGGGQLIEQIIHLYDLTRYFFGDADVVTGFAGRLGHERYPQYVVDDTSVANIRFKNGAMASISSSNCADPWYGQVQIGVVCEKVFVQFQGAEQASFLFHGGMAGEELWPTGIENRKIEEVKTKTAGLDEISRNFIAGIRDGEPLRSSVEDGLADLRLVLAVARSSAEGGAPQRI